MYKSIFLGLAVTGSAFAAKDTCKPSQPTTCYPDSCQPCHCLGPADIIANAPVNPKTCDGDFVITAALLSWKASQDGMEYAVKTNVFPGLDQLKDAAYIIDAEYLTPSFNFDIGTKIGIAYNSPCDGWDLGVLWTHFNGRASSHDEAEFAINSSDGDNAALISIWSAFNGIWANANGPVVAEDIETKWDCNGNLIDLYIGRDFWVSKYLSLRPFIGIRAVSILQDFDIQNKGGVWRSLSDGPYYEPPYNDEIYIDNDFKGIGLRGGFDLNWHLGCGWSVYSDLSAAIAYGGFDIEHEENIREAISPFSKYKILETKNHFQASRGIVDLELGVQYATLICDCKYGIMGKLGWEQHLFFHQNQMWRVVRNDSKSFEFFPNNNGENVFSQSRGTLSTQGWTLTLSFAF